MDEFLEMEKRSLISIHEAEHFFHRGMRFPDYEHKAYLMQIARAEEEVEQVYYLQHFYTMYGPTFLTPEIKTEFMGNNFEGRKNIALRLISELNL